MLPFSKYALISQNRLLPLIENCCNIWNKTRGPQPIFGEIGNQTYAAGPNGFPYRNQTCFFPLFLCNAFTLNREHFRKRQAICCHLYDRLLQEDRAHISRKIVLVSQEEIYFFPMQTVEKFVISTILKVLVFLVPDRGGA